MAVGVEREYDDNVYGLFAGYSKSYSEFQDSAIQDEGKTGVYQLGLYSGYNQGPWGIAGSVSGAYLDFETDRPTGLGTAEAEFKGAGAFADVEVSYKVPVSDDIDLYPLAALEGSYIYNESYSESGAGALNAAIDSGNTSSLSSVLGGRVSKSFDVDQTNILTSLELGWAHEYLDTNSEANVSFVNAPSVAYTSEGPDRNRDSLRVGLNLTLSGAEGHEKGFSGYAGYKGDFASNAEDHAGTVGVRYRW